MKRQTVRYLLEVAREMAADSSPIIACTFDGELLDDEEAWCAFHTPPLFTAWSEERVYFPGVYDGSFWIASAPRNPSAFGIEPVGGG